LKKASLKNSRENTFEARLILALKVLCASGFLVLQYRAFSISDRLTSDVFSSYTPDHISGISKDPVLPKSLIVFLKGVMALITVWHLHFSI
jgi:hypothetical protein